jgi:hypothetical protein
MRSHEIGDDHVANMHGVERTKEQAYFHHQSY